MFFLVCLSVNLIQEVYLIVYETFQHFEHHRVTKCIYQSHIAWFVSYLDTGRHRIYQLLWRKCTKVIKWHYQHIFVQDQNNPQISWMTVFYWIFSKIWMSVMRHYTVLIILFQKKHSRSKTKTLHFALFGDLPWHTVCQRILRFSSWCYCNPFEEWLEINNVTYKTLSRSEKKSEKCTLPGIV